MFAVLPPFPASLRAGDSGVARRLRRSVTRFTVQRSAGRSGCCDPSGTSQQDLYHGTSIMQAVFMGFFCVI